jgi:hypothetical protein
MMTSREELQERINHALQQTPEEFARSAFSDYLDTATDLTRRLYKRAVSSNDPETAVEAALDEYDALAASEDNRRARHALMEFVTHHPAAAELGLRVPDLAQRAPWMVRPSRRKR